CQVLVNAQALMQPQPAKTNEQVHTRWGSQSRMEVPSSEDERKVTCAPAGTVARSFPHRFGVLSVGHWEEDDLSLPSVLPTPPRSDGNPPHRFPGTGYSRRDGGFTVLDPQWKGMRCGVLSKGAKEQREDDTDKFDRGSRAGQARERRERYPQRVSAG